MSTGRGQDGLLAPEHVLHRAAERLAHQFTGMVNAKTVERVVFESCVHSRVPGDDEFIPSA